jgi:hypothetical protein
MSVIEIGRRSGADVDPEDDELESAMFRCAVVSRKHAKIAFTDAGKVRTLDASCFASGLMHVSRRRASSIATPTMEPMFAKLARPSPR